MLSEEGDEVFMGDVLATINPTDAEGSLEETQKRISYHRASIQRIDAWTNNDTIADLQLRLQDFDYEIASSQIEFFRPYKLT